MIIERKIETLNTLIFCVRPGFTQETYLFAYTYEREESLYIHDAYLKLAMHR